MLQVLGPAGRLPPVKVIEVLPARPFTIPPHCAGNTVAAKVKPTGDVSLKLMLLCATLPLGLVSVRVSVLVPPPRMLVGLNAFVSVRPGAPMVRVALTPLVSIASPKTEMLDVLLR